MLYSTIAEYTKEISRVQEAIKRIVLLGQAHSTGVAGNVRTVNEVPIEKLQDYLAFLQKELNVIKGNVTYLRAGW